MKIVTMTSSIILFNYFAENILTSIPDAELTLITQNSNFEKITSKFIHKIDIKIAPKLTDISLLVSELDIESRIISYNSAYIFTLNDINKFNFPILNLHTGSIPGNRGRSPLFWDIMEGKVTSIATLHAVSDKLDMGRILDTVSIKILKDDTPCSLNEKLFIKAIGDSYHGQETKNN